jgi:hypothetical protein
MRMRLLAAAFAALALSPGAAHAAPLRGTPQNDRLAGTAQRDSIRAGSGDDVVRGRDGADSLWGGPGDDSVHGDAGRDVLLGDTGRDLLLGGAGPDTLTGGPGGDRLSAGPGNDLVHARNGGRDRVDCGPGRDTAILDQRDVAVRCETIRRPRPALPAATPKATSPFAPPPAGGALPTADPGQGGVTDPPPTDPAGDPPLDPPADPPPPDDYPQLLAAGDIADCTPGAEQTAAVLDQFPGTVAALGDTAYEHGSDADFANCYDPTWGRHKQRTRPTVGSHEYDTPGAAGYWNYFGAAAGEPGKGWYSYDLGAWHIVVLNSSCAEVGGCFEGSPQVEWLREDLAAHPSECTAAYWHVPRYSSGQKHGDDLNYVAMWQVLYEFGVEFVMSGNDHHYERFAPQTPFGDVDLTDGIRQFVVGTGGRFLRPMTDTAPANSQARDNTTFGVLRVDLLDWGYEWEFVPVEGGTYTDSGTDACH